MLTQKRDLRTGLAVWLARKPAPLAPDKSLADIRAEVVVGTGISGALVADALLNVGFSLLAVDRCKPIRARAGSSTTNHKGDPQ